MEVILKEDMSGLGHKDDIVSVKNGYGRNYLIPKGLAILATKASKKIHEENLRQRSHKEEKVKNEGIIPVVKGSETALEGNSADIAKAVGKAGYYQLYYDQFLPTAVGEAVKNTLRSKSETGTQNF